jgi:hypothetical protein
VTIERVEFPEDEDTAGDGLATEITFDVQAYGVTI